jgi:hypothetical protein
MHFLPLKACIGTHFEVQSIYHPFTQITKDNLMKTEVSRNLCVICGKIEINDFWYRPLKVPPHDPSYRGAICPECRKKREMKKKSEEKPGDTITAS